MFSTSHVLPSDAVPRYLKATCTLVPKVPKLILDEFTQEKNPVESVANPLKFVQVP
jgi:hypothetical protein